MVRSTRITILYLTGTKVSGSFPCSLVHMKHMGIWDVVCATVRSKTTTQHTGEQRAIGPASQQ